MLYEAYAETYLMYQSVNLSGHSKAAECFSVGCPDNCSNDDISLTSFDNYGEVTSNVNIENTYVNAIGHKKFTDFFPNGTPITLSNFRYTGEFRLPIIPKADVNQVDNPEAVHMMMQLYDGSNKLWTANKHTLEGTIYWALNPWTSDGQKGKIKIYIYPLTRIDTGIELPPDTDWHKFELIVDFINKKYVSITIDDITKDLSAYELAQVDHNDWGTDLSFNITTESEAASPGENCENSFRWTTIFKNLKFYRYSVLTKFIKGVSYAPTPIGIDPEITPPSGDYFTVEYSSIYNRDLPLLRAMGANTIRLWGWNNKANHKDFLDEAYNDGINPIYVIIGFWISANKDIDPDSPDNVREELKEQLREMISIHKNHSAVLMWCIGNELNAEWMYGKNLDDLFSLINEMAEAAHNEEGNNYHPVTTALYDGNLLNTIATYNELVPALDVWGANIYRGKTFGSLFSDYKTVSNKPFAILEYGIDSYDNVNSNEYQDVQAEYAEALWKEMESNQDICLGGSIMAYSDEWWKGKYSTDCDDKDPSFHGLCGYLTSAHPDGYSNEEWWGIMRTVDNDSEPDIMEPRTVYYTLKNLWSQSSTLYNLTVTKKGTGSGTVTSDPSGIDCGDDCDQAYEEGTTVTQTATPDPGSVFTGWSGACSGTEVCTVIMNSDQSVTATFNTSIIGVTHTLTVTNDGTGTGTVTSNPPGINNCSDTCFADFAEGANVVLSATPDAGSVFAGWSGDCNASGSITMDFDKTCSATFNAKTPVQLIKGILIKKKDSGGKDKVTLKLKNCSNMSILELANSSVYISIADGKTTLYSKEISGSEFKPNGNETVQYTYKEESPEKHKDTLFPANNKITCNIKKATIGDITDSGGDATESTKDIKVQITVGSKTYEAVNTWTVKDSSKKTKLIFKQ